MVLPRYIRKFLDIQALMCVALMSILYRLGTNDRSLTRLETYPQVSNWKLSDLTNMVSCQMSSLLIKSDNKFFSKHYNVMYAYTAPGLYSSSVKN